MIMKKSLFIITLALSWSGRICQGSSSAVGVQWANPTSNYGLEDTLSAIQYHAQDNTLYLVGNTVNACWYGSIAVGSDSMNELALVDTSPREGECQTLVVSSSSKENGDDDDTDINTLVWIAGNSVKSQILSELPTPPTIDTDEGDKEDYSFLMNVAWEVTASPQAQITENNSTTRTRHLRALEQNDTLTDAAEVAEMAVNESNVSDIPGGLYAENVQTTVRGGILMPHEKSTTSMTTGVVESQHHLYTLSLLQNQGFFTSSNSGRLVVHAWKKINYNASDSGAVQTLGESHWTQHIATEQDNVGILNAAGIISVADVLLVAGSTRGTGEGLGISSGGTSTNGFLTKLFRYDGNLYGDTNETADEVSSLRIKTQENKTTYVHSLCAGGDDSDYIYVTGWTDGNVPMANGTLYSGGSSAKAFLMRIQVSTMEVMGTFQMGTVDGQASRGLACAVDNDEYVYLAGNVENAGVMHGVESSGGATDVFLAKMEVSLNGTIEWVRQIGGPSNDTLAPFGGLAVTSDGKIIVAGNTNGPLYRTRAADEESSNAVEVFVAMVTHHGRVPDVVVSEDAVTTIPTNKAPTVSPATQAPSLPLLATNKPTSPPTVPAQVFNFQNMTIRLNDGPKLTKDAQQVFEASTVEFYRYVYFDKRRRRLQDGFGVSSFESVVKFQEQSHDKTGNAITYHQEISFISNGQLSEEQARSLLVAPFENDQQAKLYLELLKEGDDSFRETTSVNVPLFPGDEDPSLRPPSSSDGDGGLNGMLFLYIALGILVCCCTAAYYFTRRKDNETLLGDRDDDDYDPETDMYERPEQPIGVDPGKMFEEASTLSFGFGDIDTPDTAGVVGDKYGMSMIGDDLFLDEGDNTDRITKNTAKEETPVSRSSRHGASDLFVQAVDDKESTESIAPHHTADSDDESGSGEGDDSGSEDDDQSGSGSDDDLYKSDEESSSEGDRFA
mmetsp:Transcript_1242/g.2443  ORF Transcript_1242/g.2443 Transcript_1242/m.2443 type:complete len:954 (-) Transcript_1242:60-2921(-)